MGRWKKTCCGGITLILGTGILVISLTASLIVSRLLAKQLKYLPGTLLYTQWQSPPVRSFHIFVMNVTNVEDVLNGSKPVLQEIGPYIYDEIKKPHSIQFNDDKTVLSYNMHTKFVFNATKTKASNDGDELDPLLDEVTVPNVLFHSILSMCQDPQSSLAPVCNMFEYGALVEFEQQPFETLTVDGLIWGQATNFSIFMNELSQGLLPANFSLLHKETIGRRSGIETGKSNRMDIAQFVEWNGKPSLDVWGSPQANMINGSSGEVFRPFLDRDDVKILPVFVDNTNRSFDLSYKHDTTVRGVQCRRYVLPCSQMQNSTLNPEQAQWYSFGPSGLLNMSVIQGGAPIYLSKPHFLQAEHQLLNNITILPSTSTWAKQLDTHLDVEPITGITLSAVKSLQTNIFIQPFNGSLSDQLNTENLRHTYFPIFWAQETAEIGKTDAHNLHKSALLPYRIVTSNYMYIGVGFGVLLILISVMIIIRALKKYRDRHNWQLVPLNTDDSPNLIE